MCTVNDREKEGIRERKKEGMTERPTGQDQHQLLQHSLRVSVLPISRAESIVMVTIALLTREVSRPTVIHGGLFKLSILVDMTYFSSVLLFYLLFSVTRITLCRGNW